MATPDTPSEKTKTTKSDTAGSRKKEIGAKTSTLRKVGKGLAWAFAIESFNPKRWLSDGGYEHGSVVKTAWANAVEVWRPKRKDEIIKETFDEAVKRLELTEEQLAVRHREFVLSSRVSYLCGLAVLMFSAYHACRGNLAGGAGGLAFAMVGFCNGYLQAFQAWKISTRQLIRLGAFFHVPDAWLV